MACTEHIQEHIRSLPCHVFAALDSRMAEGTSSDALLQAGCDALSRAYPDNDIQCPVTCTDIRLSCLRL